MGAGCKQCHSEENWKASFGPEQHAQTGFPLTGRHAVIPCVQCHAEMSDRTFSRAPRACVACHQQDYTNTTLIPNTINHVKANFGTDCQSCHLTFAFSPARFPGHDYCFQITAGPHAGIRCLNCHTSLSNVVANGSCNTFTAACTACHSHAQQITDQQHASNAAQIGYQYKDRKCYECHNFEVR